MTTNARRVAEALVAEGVRYGFGLMGNGNLELISELVDHHGLKYLSARHESAAVAAADGYARVSGDVGLALVTYGPGLTNAITAIVTARRAQSPVVIVAGDASWNTGRSTQKLDQNRLAASIDLPVVQPAENEDWASATHAALDLARRTGAVLLNLPAARLGQKYDTSDASPSSLAKPSDNAPAPANDADLASDAQIGATLDLIGKAKRPLVLIGRGTRRAGQIKTAIELARLLGAPIGTTMAARGASAVADNDIGLVGGLGSAVSHKASQACDLLIALGASLNGFTTEHGTYFGNARIVRFDERPDAPSSVDVDVSVLGRLEETLPRVLARLPSAPRQRWTVGGEPVTNSSLDWPGRVFSTLDGLLPAARCVVYDHGDLANSSVPHLRAHDESQSVFMPDFGSLGLSVASAIGAATARPDRVTVAVLGDGGMFMSLPDLDMLHRTGLPVLVLVMNDQAFGAEIGHLRALGASLAPAFFQSSGLAGIACAIGLSVFELTEADGTQRLAEAVKQAAAGPVLVEVHCKPPMG